MAGNELEHLPHARAAAGAAIALQTNADDPALALVQSVWPALPEVTKRRILALIRKASKQDARRRAP